MIKWNFSLLFEFKVHKCVCLVELLYNMSTVFYVIFENIRGQTTTRSNFLQIFGQKQNFHKLFQCF